jgi:hypothetical protein
MITTTTTQTHTILTISLIAGLTIITTASFTTLLFPAQDVCIIYRFGGIRGSFDPIKPPSKLANISRV